MREAQRLARMSASGQRRNTFPLLFFRAQSRKIRANSIFRSSAHFHFSVLCDCLSGRLEDLPIVFGVLRLAVSKVDVYTHELTTKHCFVSSGFCSSQGALADCNSGTLPRTTLINHEHQIFSVSCLSSARRSTCCMARNDQARSCLFQAILQRCLVQHGEDACLSKSTRQGRLL